ncbi:MAG: PDZ domain-containing protein [Pseudomonadota bacterium]
MQRPDAVTGWRSPRTPAGLAAVLFAALLLASGAPVRAGAVQADREIVVPTELCRGFWFIPVTLQPRDREAPSRTLWFLHDTGASNSYVDPDSLERVTGRRLEANRRVRIVDASAGPVRFNRLSVRVDELDHLSIALGREIDGILSVHTFDDFLQILDYPGREMRLRTGALPRPDGRSVFSSRGPDRRPWVEVDFAGRTQRLLVDSGAAGTAFAVNDIDDFALLAPARPLAGAVRFNRLEARRIARLDGQAELAGLRFDSPVLEEVPNSPLLGGEALRRYVVVLDQTRRRVAFYPTESGPVAAEPAFEFGAVLRPRLEGLEVERLFPETPFAEAGLRRGDLITHFDGQPVAERGCSRAQHSGQIELRVLRDGADQTIPVNLWPVLPAPGP